MTFTKNISRLATLAFILIGFLSLLYNNFINQTFWYDEAYTIAMMQHSFSDIWKITAMDVHPPLYYFMLKLFTELFGDSLFTMRIFSNLGIIACYLLGIFPIKRLFGDKVSFTFILLMVLMPINQYLGVEIRMYSWAMFFVLASSIYGYETFQKKMLISYSKMTFFAICAAYTHYYALIAIFSIFLILIIYLLRRKKTIVRPLLFAIILLLAYIPWIPIFASQVYNVHQSFWVEIPTSKDILLFCYYFFSPKEPSHPYTIFSIWSMSATLLITLGLILSVIVLTVRLHMEDKPNKKLRAASYFILIFISTIIITFAITFIIKPISVPRYASCMLGSLVLGISIYGVELYKTKAKPIIIAILVMLVILSIARLFSERAYYISQNKEFAEMKSYIQTKDMPLKVIAPLESYPSLAKLSILFPRKEYLLFSPNDNTNYLPFEIKKKEQLPSIGQFILVQSVNDTTQLSDGYTVKSKLESTEIIISLIEATPKQ
ncbi:MULTISPECIES: glycosyltransferase family 39 protein [unclassified Dysgonomonas]|uniref:glycosyltransferase family 39 protein n=1 Tax=unclassified Dysgonomonas TaxID=2630389 RepID=UPI0006818A78|nr:MULTISPECIES: glycosyltransferase family 39 protein [unclassified Dysgonomonas]MBD8349097.1 glycosyltransferase family 39 protein [Dysgonomonas sp. HGC4]MBF0576551.1 glycosyltransferase family 39 protein [Dysgonomonas sp. GY617]